MAAIDRAALRSVLDDVRESYEYYLQELKVEAHDSIGMDTTASQIAHGKGVTDGASLLWDFLEQLAEPVLDER